MGQVKNVMQIEEHIFEVTESFLRQNIGGGVYYEGTRPHDSKLEDAVIVVTTASADQVQEGRANINIYTQNIDNGTERSIQNRGRLQELAELSNDILSLLNDADSSYEWEFALVPFPVQASNYEYYISISLSFKVTTY